MSVTLRKDVLRAGLYRKGGDEIEVTPEDITALNQDTKLLESRGYRAPFWVEHPGKGERKAAPIKLGTAMAAEVERDPFFAGWVKSHVFGDDGTVRVEVQPDSEQQASKLIESGGFVSAQWGPFKDDEGNKYGQVFHHHALTRKPVNKQQSTTFEPVTAPVNRIKAAEMTEPVRFSLDDIVEDESEDGIVRFADDEDGDDGTQSKGDDDKCTEACQKALKGLEAYGVTVAQDSPLAKHREGLADLLSTVSRMAAYQEREKESMSKETKGSGNGTASVSESPVVVQMSEEGAPAGETPKPAHTNPDQVVQMSEFTALQARSKRLEAIATDNARRDYARRIDAVVKSGRCTTERAKSLTDLANTHQFSDSTDKTELDIRLETIEELPAGAVWTDEQKVQQFSAEELPHSPFFSNSDEPSDEEIDAYAKGVAN